MKKDSVICLSEIVKILFLPHSRSNNNNDDAIRLKKFAKIENEKKDKGDIGRLAKIIDTIRKRNIEYRWAPLALLKFNETGTIDEESIANVLHDICVGKIEEHISENDHLKYGLKATVAGRKFVELCSEFEYFAARYTHNLENCIKCSLFDQRLFNEDRDGSILSIKLAKLVKDKAFCCIDSMVKKAKEITKIPLCHSNDDDEAYNYNALYTPAEKRTLCGDAIKYLYVKYDIEKRCFSRLELTHSERVIISHIRYLHDYRRFVLNELIYTNNEVNNILGRPLSNSLNKIFEQPDTTLANALSNADSLFHTTRSNLGREEVKEACNKFKKAIKISFEVIEIIEKYVDKLKYLTTELYYKKPNSDYYEYYIGGCRRSKMKNIKAYEEEEYSYKSIHGKLMRIKANPFNMQNEILPQKR